MLVPDANVKRRWMLKMVKTVTNIVKLSSTDFVTNIDVTIWSPDFGRQTSTEPWWISSQFLTMYRWCYLYLWWFTTLSANLEKIRFFGMHFRKYFSYPGDNFIILIDCISFWHLRQHLGCQTKTPKIHSDIKIWIHRTCCAPGPCRRTYGGRGTFRRMLEFWHLLGI